MLYKTVCAIICGMIVVQYDKVKDALTEYISFMLNIAEDGCDASDAEKTDRKRRALHDKVVEAFGYPKDYFWRERVFTFSVENIASGYEPVVDDSRNVEWMSKYVYDYISDKLHDVDYCGVKTDRRLKHYGLHNFEVLMKDYNEFLSECESVLAEWDSLKDKYNDSIEGSGKKCEEKSFWHEVNGAKSNVKSCEKTIREFLSMPTDAFTDAARKKYYEEPWNSIIESKKKIAYEVVKCQIYMKQFKEHNKEILKNA